MKTPRSSFKAAILLLSALAGFSEAATFSRAVSRLGSGAPTPIISPRLASPSLFPSLSPLAGLGMNSVYLPGSQAPQPSLSMSMEASFGGLRSALAEPRLGDMAVSAGPVPGSDGPSIEASGLDSPEAFARRAEQLFHGGKLAEGRHGAVAYGPAPFRPEGQPASDEEILQEMSRSPLTNPQREQVIVELFKQAGAKPEEIKLQDAGRNRNNIIVVKKGRTDKIVVVGAHHDKVHEGAGTIDNWTGATMVTNLYQALRDEDTEATFIFVAFAREEEGLLGAEHFLNTLPMAQRNKISAMLNLDTLAVDGTFSWKNNSTRSMLDLIKKVAQESRLDLTEAYLSGGDADSSVFRNAGIPAMTLFGASQEVIFDIIHSENDNMAYFNAGHYRNSYLLSIAMLKALDRATPNRQPHI